MAHPFAEHRQTKKEHSRVGHITNGYATGGAVKHSDEAEDRKLIRSMVKKADLKADGGKAKHRMDRPKRKRAEGGPIKMQGNSDGSVRVIDPRTGQVFYSGSASGAAQAQAQQAARIRRMENRGGAVNRAKGGRVGKKGNAKTIVNVITGGHPAAGGVPPGPPMAASPPMGIAPAGMAPPPTMPARPPMPGPGMPPGGPPGGPPMPMRAKGGRINRADGGGAFDANRQLGQGMLKVLVPIEKKYGNAMQSAQRQQMDETYSKVGRARGGQVHKPHGSPVFNESVREGTQVQHDPGKNDLKDMGRGKPVTFKSGGRVRSFYARGGKVEASDKVEAASKLPGGSGGGKARLAKEHRAERNYARPAK